MRVRLIPVTTTYKLYVDIPVTSGQYGRHAAHMRPTREKLLLTRTRQIYLYLMRAGLFRVITFATPPCVAFIKNSSTYLIRLC